MTINSVNLQPSQQLDEAKKPYDKALQNIAVARAIDSADGASLAIANSLRTDATTIEQGINNAYDAIGVLQIADSALASIENAADELARLSVQKNSGLLNDSQRAMIDSRALALTTSIDNAYNNATYNGKNVFSSLDFVVGTGTESANLTPVGVGDMSVDKLDSITDFIDRVGSLRADIGAGASAITSNINASLSKELGTRLGEGELLNDDAAKNAVQLNTGFLLQNAAAFSAAQKSQVEQSRVLALLQ